MSPAQLLAALTLRGICFVADGERLLVRPADALALAERELLRAHKPKILRLLRSEGEVRNRASEAFPCSTRHKYPSTWTYSLDRYRRPGWRTVTCRLCGGFIGYQPPKEVL